LNIEDKRRIFLRNVWILQCSDAASNSRKTESSATLLQEPQNSVLGRDSCGNIKRFGERGVRYEVDEIILHRVLQGGFKKKKK